jgi:transcriptional regulator of aromatic amino acid metabolism
MPASITHYQQATLNQSQEYITICAAANQPFLIVGSPGIGKSTIVKSAAPVLGLTPVLLDTNAMDASDFGYPYVDPKTGELSRRPIHSGLLRACSEPCLLFIDEIGTTAPMTRPPLMRLLLDREVGDSMRLHPETRIVCATNRPDEAPNATELESTLTGRMAIVEMEPSLIGDRENPGEIFSYFADVLGAGAAPSVAPSVPAFSQSDFDEALARWAGDFAATLIAKTDLVQINPADAVINEGAQGSGDGSRSPARSERAVFAAALACRRG